MSNAIHLTVCGLKHEHAGDGSVAALLKELDAPLGRVAVLRNGMAVRRHEFASVHLEEGDEVEILTLAAGG